MATFLELNLRRIALGDDLRRLGLKATPASSDEERLAHALALAEWIEAERDFVEAAKQATQGD